MAQQYHLNAKTNVHFRKEINKSNLTQKAMAENYQVSMPTIAKWRKRDSLEDKSSRPHTIHYALDIEKKIFDKGNQGDDMVFSSVYLGQHERVVS